MSRGRASRQGDPPGVILKPAAEALRELALSQTPDRVAAVVARTKRGPIDRPFAVDRSNALQALGPESSNLVHPAHEARVHVTEALDAGASAVIVSRLVTSATRKKFVAVYLQSFVENVLETGPYPVYEVEGIDTGFAITGGNFGMPLQQEELESGFAITGGSYPIRAVTGTYVHEPMAVESGFAITDGTFPLTVRYLTANPDVDAVNSGFAITGGTFPLTVRYLTGGYDPESLNSGFAITGGTLT